MGTEPREELKAKQLEKVIYFAANLVTWVDDEKRQPTCPTSADWSREDAIEKERELPIAERFRLAREGGRGARSRGAKGPPTIKSRRMPPNKDTPRCASSTTPRLRWSSGPSTSYRPLSPRKIIEDEMLWRELKDRYGDILEGGMGADALKS
jgi:DNA-directed RNA polymerase subunit beta'